MKSSQFKSQPLKGHRTQAGGTAQQTAEKVEIATSAAKAATDNKALIAALEALRHPKPEFFRIAALEALRQTKPEFFRNL